MSRTVRARGSEPANQPLYARMLRLRNLAPSSLLCFVFLEGAVVLGILLALAELVSWWGVIVLPVTVALMVKFNDLVAGALDSQPVTGTAKTAHAAVLRPAAMYASAESAATAEVTGAPRTVGTERSSGFGPAGAAFTRAPASSTTADRTMALGAAGPGRPSVPGERSGLYGSAMAGSASGGRTTHFGPDREDWPVGYGPAPIGAGGGYGPVFAGADGGQGPVAGSAAGEWDAGDRQLPGERTVAFEVASGDRPGDTLPVASEESGDCEWDENDRAGGFTPTATPVASMPLGVGYAPMVSPGLPPLGHDPAASAEGAPEAPAVGYPGSYSRGLSGSGCSSGARGHDDDGQHQVRSTLEPVVEEHRGSNAPVRRAWADDLDVQQQVARQAASRRYE